MNGWKTSSGIAARRLNPLQFYGIWTILTCGFNCKKESACQLQKMQLPLSYHILQGCVQNVYSNDNSIEHTSLINWGGFDRLQVDMIWFNCWSITNFVEYFSTQRALIQKRPSGNKDIPDGLAYFNLGGGKFYEKERVHGHDSAKEGYASPHSVTALTLNTLPLHSGEEELKDLHRSHVIFRKMTHQLFHCTSSLCSYRCMHVCLLCRSRNFWVSLADMAPSRRLTSNGSVNIVFQSVTGRAGTVVRNVTEPNDVSIGHLFLQVVYGPLNRCFGHGSHFSQFWISW